MLEFIAGCGAGTVVWMALSFTRASRKDRKAREQMRRFAEMQVAAWAVQDQSALIIMDPPKSSGGWIQTLDRWEDLRDTRDRAAAAYFAAMGE